jgi:hypothetical protein
VGILARMLILQDDDLNVDCIDICLLGIVQQLSLERNSIPSTWFLQLEVLHLLEILHVVSCFDWNLGRSVGLIWFEIEEQAQFLDPCLLHELDVDEMGLRAIGLPEGIGIVVPELLDSISSLCRGEGPDCFAADLSSWLVVDRRCGIVDIGCIWEFLPCSIQNSNFGKINYK